MVKDPRTRAEEQFAKLQKQQPATLSESEIAAAERGEKMARLKALRLAKESEAKSGKSTGGRA